MVWQTLNAAERRRLFGIWVLILIGMILETFSLGLIIPMVGLLTQDDYKTKIPFGESLFSDLDQRQLLVVAMLFVVIIYIIKSSFVYWSALHQRRFVNAASARVSQETFTKYLRQPYE
ncbi:MAG: hypothetical protein EBY80_03410, partial [Actinobacteria bacterium]|nr:hypothetical protein [Actinomycetota bacterium]